MTQAGLNGSPASVAVSLKVIQATPYLNVTPEAVTFTARGGTDPAPAYLSINNAGGGTISPSLSAKTADGSNWLAVSQPTGGSYQNSQTAKVEAHVGSLANGTYKGTITVTSPGASNSGLNIPVTLTVGSSDGAIISVSPASISFLAGLGANPYLQNLVVNNGGTGVLKPSVTTTGGNWLVVGQPTGGSFGGSFAVGIKADITGLSKGTYNGSITVSDPNSVNGSVTVPVLLTLTDPQPVMSLSESWLGYGAQVGAYIPMGLFVYVQNVGTGAMPWSTSVATDAGGNWLKADPPSGTAAFTSPLTVSADPTGLPAGIYNGTVVFTAANAVAGVNPQKVKVTLAIGTDLPSPARGGTVNGASFAGRAIAPGSLISIFGEKMAPSSGIVNSSYVDGKLPSQAGGVQVTFTYTDNTGMHTALAPLYYAGPGGGANQINAQVPVELAGQSLTSMQVIYNGVPSRGMLLSVAASDPGIFLSGGKPIIVFNNTATMVTADNPAKPGDWLVIYATGLGAVYNGSTRLETGVMAPLDANRLFTVQDPVNVNIAGTDVTPPFAGATPGYVGLYQINFQVPLNAASGANSLILSVGKQQTAPLTLYVR